MKEKKIFKKRNVFPVIFWTYSLYVIVYKQLYISGWIGTLISDASFESIITNKYNDPQILLLKGLIGFFIGLPLLFLIIKFLWRRSLNWMCLNFYFRYFLQGTIGGFLIALLITVILFLLGVVSVTAYPGRMNFIDIISSFTGILTWTILFGITEEVVFRGMAAREIAVKLGWIKSSIISGIYFGVAHILAVIHLISIYEIIHVIFAGTITGFLFVGLLIRSKSLWLPIGFHIGWNFTLKAILGTTMSGKSSEFGLFTMKLSGPDWLTGGGFGIEGSLISMVIFLILSVGIWKNFRKSPEKFLSRHNN